MVRFSDMLGGSGEPDDDRATKSPFDALVGDMPDDLEPEPEPEPEVEPATEAPEAEAEAAPQPEPETDAAPAADFESPEEVLQRLTRYATSARAAPPGPSVTAPVEEEPLPEPPAPTGDDLLPHGKNIDRKPGRKRRP